MQKYVQGIYIKRENNLIVDMLLCKLAYTFASLKLRSRASREADAKRTGCIETIFPKSGKLAKHSSRTRLEPVVLSAREPLPP